MTEAVNFARISSDRGCVAREPAKLRTTLFYACVTRRQREILPHEDSLVRYLTRTSPNRDDVHDLRQEIYVSPP